MSLFHSECKRVSVGVCPVCRRGIGKTELVKVVNARGICFASACFPCSRKIRERIVHVIDRYHGAMIDADGTYHCSPWGTPSYQSIAEAEEYIRRRMRRP